MVEQPDLFGEDNLQGDKTFDTTAAAEAIAANAPQNPYPDKPEGVAEDIGIVPRRPGEETVDSVEAEESSDTPSGGPAAARAALNAIKERKAKEAQDAQEARDAQLRTLGQQITEQRPE